MNRLLVFLILIIGFQRSVSGQEFQKSELFIKNNGQWPSEVLFQFRSDFIDYWITQSGIVVNQRECNWDRDSDDMLKVRGYVTPLTWINSQHISQFEGTLEFSKWNFILSANPDSCFTDIPTYSEVTLKNLYDKVDIRYYIENHALKYDLILHPGAQLNEIGLQTRNSPLELLKNGNVTITNEYAELIHSKPDSYQIVNGKKTKQASKIELTGDLIKFESDWLDSTSELIIDPLIYSTYFAGSTATTLSKVDISDNNEVYVGGNTTSNTYPLTAGAYDNTLNGTGNCNSICSSNVVISKFNSEGSNLVFSTVIGGDFSNGTLNDYLTDIDVLDDGSVLCTGRYQSNFPITLGSPNTGYCFLSKLNAQGNSLLFSLGWGGTGSNAIGSDVEHDNDGNILLYGRTQGNSIVLTQNSFNASLQTVGPLFNGGYIAKFNSTGTQNIFSVILNAGANSVGNIQIDSANNIYAAVSTNHGLGIYPTSFSSDAFQPNYTSAPNCSQFNSGNCKTDIQYFKISPDGSLLLGGTYLGSIDNEYPKGLVVNSDGSVNILCASYSPTFLNYTNSGNTYLVKISGDGNNLLASVQCNVNKENLTKYLDSYSKLISNFQEIQIINNSTLSTIYSSGAMNSTGGYYLQMGESNYIGCLAYLGETGVTQMATPGVYDQTLNTIGSGQYTDNFIGVMCDMLNQNFYQDLDNDGYGNNGVIISAILQPAGYVTNNLDCNDLNNLINPEGIEVCDGIDNNCNAQTDEGFPTTAYFFDVDLDSFGDPNSSVNSCFQINGYVPNNLDCNDNNSLINPSASEICNNTDDDCNALTDDGLTFLTYYLDSDSDSYGDNSIYVSSCVNLTGYVTMPGDCNDNNSLTNPNGSEVCNNIDDDCNSLIDDGITFIDYYLDLDQDGYGNGQALSSCETPVGIYVLNNIDCSPLNPLINPGQLETCNSIDDDCNSLIDDGLIFNTYYFDADADGYYISDSSSCEILGGNYTLIGVSQGDCNDNNSLINAGELELCDEIDNNCNTFIDEGFDQDNDGYTNCNGDCNDNDPLVHPNWIQINYQPIQNQTACLNTNLDTLQVSVNANPQNLFYQWYISTENSYNNSIAINNANSNWYLPANYLAGTNYYYCQITSSIDTCLNLFSNISSVSILNKPNNINTNFPPAINICQYDTPEVLEVANGVNYTWYANQDSSYVGGSIINSGTTNTTYSPITSIEGSYYYYCLIQLADTSVCPEAFSPISKVNVFGLPQLVSNLSPLDTAACLASSDLILNIDVLDQNSNFTFEWNINTNPNTINATIVENVNDTVWEFHPDTIGTYFIFCKIEDVISSCSITSSISSVEVLANPLINLTADSIDICEGEYVTFLATGAPTFEWSDGINNGDSIQVLSDQTFIITGIGDNGCTSSKEFTVNYSHNPNIQESINTSTMAFGDDASIDIQLFADNLPCTFDWSNDGTGDFDDYQNLVGVQAGDYSLTIRDSLGCVSHYSFNIPLNINMFIPTAISPNADGYNDTWEIRGLEQFEWYEISVFNNQGTLVFRKANNYFPWDGRYNSEYLMADDYIYVIDTKNPGRRFTGFITITY